MDDKVKIFSYVYKNKEYEILHSLEYDKYYVNLKRGNNIVSYIEKDFNYSISFVRYLIENEGY